MFFCLLSYIVETALPIAETADQIKEKVEMIEAR